MRHVGNTYVPSDRYLLVLSTVQRATRFGSVWTTGHQCTWLHPLNEKRNQRHSCLSVQLLYTPERLAQHHANSSSPWIAILGEVYDVSAAKNYYGVHLHDRFVHLSTIHASHSTSSLRTDDA